MTLAPRTTFDLMLDVLAHMACCLDETAIEPGIVPSAFVESRSNSKQISQGVWRKRKPGSGVDGRDRRQQSNKKE